MSNTSTPMSRSGLGGETSARKVRIVAYGEVLWDVFADSSPARKNREFLGGSAANVAYHAALLGAESHLVSRVGRDARGHRALHQLRQAGVHLARVSLDSGHPTGTVNVSFDGVEPRYRISEHVAWDYITVADETYEEISRSDVLCLSTLAGRTKGAHRERLALLRRLHQLTPPSPYLKGTQTRPLCLLDLNLRPPFVSLTDLLELLPLIDVLKVNESELAWLAKSLNVRSGIDFLLRRFSLRFLFLTRAERGAALFGHSVRVEAPGLPIIPGDAVGAGDAFVGSLAVSLAKRLPVSITLSLANAHGAWVASQKGAMPLAPR